MLLRAKTKELLQTRELTKKQINNTRLNKEEMDKKATILKSYPQRLVLELTNACNLKCIMCGRDEAEFAPTLFKLEYLKKLLGIKSTTDYVIDGSYNMIDLINNYVEFEKSYNYLVKYKEFSIDKFSEIENYNSIIKPIYEYAIIEQQSSYKPEKITFDFIDNKIKRGDFKSAVADMVIKVDYDLTKELSLNDSNEMDFYDKIMLAENNKLIKPNEASLLHTLRICRNKLLHPSKDEIHFNIDELNKWNEYIFKSEVNNEPSSKN